MIENLMGLIGKFDNEKKIKGLTEFEQMQVYNALKYLDMYQKIGTISEILKLKETQTPKKPAKDEYNHDCCPNCGWIVYKGEYGGRYLPHCENCGQAIEWNAAVCQ